MSNGIVENLVTLLTLIAQWRPSIFIMVEQPKGSFMFKMPVFDAMLEDLGFALVLTYLGLFGLSILKGTHLRTNLPTLTRIVSSLLLDFS